MIPAPIAPNTTQIDVTNVPKSNISVTFTSSSPLKINGVYIARFSGNMIIARMVLIAVMVTESAKSDDIEEKSKEMVSIAMSIDISSFNIIDDT